MIPKRLNGVEELLQASDARKILIDHHQDPVSFTDIAITETSRGSVGEMIYLFLTEIFGERYAGSAILPPVCMWPL